MFKNALIWPLALLACVTPLFALPHEGGLTGPDGREVACPLPASEKKHNIGGTDGAGLCVWTSLEYCARYQNVRCLFDLQEKMSHEPGGGWPARVDEVFKTYPGLQYLQDTTGDPTVLDLALKTGRPVGITYSGNDCHYQGNVAHMVMLVYLDDQYAAISDNNYPGDSQTVWMTRAEFLQRWRGWRTRDGGWSGNWCVVLLAPPPPPVPHTKSQAEVN